MVLDIAGGDTAVHQKIPQVRGGGSSGPGAGFSSGKCNFKTTGGPSPSLLDK